MFKNCTSSSCYLHTKQLTTPSNEHPATSHSLQVFKPIPFLTVQVKPSAFVGARWAQDQELWLEAYQAMLDLHPVSSACEVPPIWQIIRLSFQSNLGRCSCKAIRGKHFHDEERFMGCTTLIRWDVDWLDLTWQLTKLVCCERPSIRLFTLGETWITYILELGLDLSRMRRQSNHSLMLHGSRADTLMVKNSVTFTIPDYTFPNPIPFGAIPRQPRGLWNMAVLLKPRRQLLRTGGRHRSIGCVRSYVVRAATLYMHWIGRLSQATLIAWNVTRGAGLSAGHHDLFGQQRITTMRRTDHINNVLTSTIGAQWNGFASKNW